MWKVPKLFKVTWAEFLNFPVVVVIDMPLSSIRLAVVKEKNQMIFVIHTTQPSRLVQEAFQNLAALPLDEVSVKRFHTEYDTWHQIFCKSEVEPMKDARLEGGHLLYTLLSDSWKRLFKVEEGKSFQEFFDQNLVPMYKEDDKDVNNFEFMFYRRHSSETANVLPSYDDRLRYDEIAKITQEVDDLDEGCEQEAAMYKERKHPLTLELLRELQNKRSITRGSWMIYLNAQLVMHQFLKPAQISELQQDYVTWKACRDDWMKIPDEFQGCKEKCLELLIAAKASVIESFFNGELSQMPFVDQIAIRRFENRAFMVRVFNKTTKCFNTEPPKHTQATQDFGRMLTFLKELDAEPFKVAHVLTKVFGDDYQYLQIKYKPHLYTLLQIYDWEPRAVWTSVVYRILLSNYNFTI
ncbi:unnamed protein product, partial [Mesorhabditis belari]|uniref:Uncharacterized protein n=1 Tax=Mesorhabditis belari TaxID=2138241 RepID=A0AAF3J6K5_9BILA